MKVQQETEEAERLAALAAQAELAKKHFAMQLKAALKFKNMARSAAKAVFNLELAAEAAARKARHLQRATRLKVARKFKDMARSAAKAVFDVQRVATFAARTARNLQRAAEAEAAALALAAEAQAAALVLAAEAAAAAALWEADITASQVDECLMCMDASRSMCAAPCNHLVYCQGCSVMAGVFPLCGICAQPIHGYVPVQNLLTWRIP